MLVCKKFEFSGLSKNLLQLLAQCQFLCKNVNLRFKLTLDWARIMGTNDGPKTGKEKQKFQDSHLCANIQTGQKQVYTPLELSSGASNLVKLGRSEKTRCCFGQLEFISRPLPSKATFGFIVSCLVNKQTKRSQQLWKRDHRQKLLQNLKLTNGKPSANDWFCARKTWKVLEKKVCKSSPKWVNGSGDWGRKIARKF